MCVRLSELCAWDRNGDGDGWDAWLWEVVMG
jgi:hypothetical protein